MDLVECPRCGLRISARLHGITSTDAQACPRCDGQDGLEIPMFVAHGPADPTHPGTFFPKPAPARGDDP